MTIALPTVSIIIPVYNVHSYIRGSLLSALDQSYGDIEYIIIDDCSTDSTLSTIQDVLLVHPRAASVRLLAQDVNKGQSAARNRALGIATGNYIMFLDSDDELLPGAIERLVSQAVASQADMVVADYTTRDENRQSDTVTHFDLPPVTRADILELWTVLQIAPWNKLIRSARVPRFTEGMIYEDLAWSLRLLGALDSVAYLPESTYIYRLRSCSTMTARPTRRNIDSFLRFLGEADEFFATSKISAAIAESIDRRRVTILKQLFEVRDLGCRYRYASLLALRRGARRPSAAQVPPYSRAVGRALVLAPAPVAYIYLWLLHNLYRIYRRGRTQSPLRDE